MSYLVEILLLVLLHLCRIPVPGLPLSRVRMEMIFKVMS